MEIEIKLFASLRQYAPDPAAPGVLHYQAAPGDTVATVVEQLAIPSEAVKLVFINGVHANRDQPLAPGDRLGIFPAVAGG